MSTRKQSHLRAILAVLLTIAVLAPVYAANKASKSADAAGLAQADLDATRSSVSRLTDLLKQSAAVGDRPSPEPDFVARLHNALHLTGIDPQRLTRVSMKESQPIRGSEFHKQAVAITIGPIRAPDLARCLNQWTAEEPLWTIRSVRLDRVSENRSNQRGDWNTTAPTDEYTAAITMERIHLASSTNSQGSTP